MAEVPASNDPKPWLLIVLERLRSAIRAEESTKEETAQVMTVTVLQRYSDCSVWKCPNCGVVGDDRPLSWGGSFERVDDKPAWSVAP